MNVRNLRPLAFVVIALVVADAAWAPLILGWARFAPVSFAGAILPIAHAADAGETIFKIVTMIVFACWIWLAGRNLVAQGIEDLEFSPASRVWWFFVPIASLFKPFQGMRELWNASRGVWPYDQNDALVGIWWAAWLLKNYVSWLLLVALSGDGGRASLWVTSILDVAAAVPAVIIVYTISRAQSGFDRAALAEVFA